MNIEYAILVKNKTRLEQLIERFNTKAQAEFYIKQQGGDFAFYEKEHLSFYETLAIVEQKLAGKLKFKLLDREYVPSFLFSAKHLIIVVGQDGLVANTAKYSGGCPILAINPAPDYYDGVLLPFHHDNFLLGLTKVLKGEHNSRALHFAEVLLQDGQKLLAFNELFVGAATHVSARYKLEFQDQQETQSSSGLIISTKAGSTAWLSSIFNMVNGVNSVFGFDNHIPYPSLKDRQLLFVAREPFKSLHTKAGLVTGILNRGGALKIESLMPQNGVIFSDGIESDFLHFNSGAIAKVGLAKEQAFLVE